jgi:hypothetical protein
MALYKREERRMDIPVYRWKSEEFNTRTNGPEKPLYGK